VTAAEILAAAWTHDIVLDVQGDRLVVDGPIGTLTPELIAEFARHKPALMALLTQTFVTLKNGPTLPMPAIALALDLERRGFRLSLDADGQVIVEPTATLTETDLAAIRRWHLHVGAIVAYSADAEERTQ
jgi:TubC N-terminal docking domain